MPRLQCKKILITRDCRPEFIPTRSSRRRLLPLILLVARRLDNIIKKYLRTRSVRNTGLVYLTSCFIYLPKLNCNKFSIST